MLGVLQVLSRLPSRARDYERGLQKGMPWWPVFLMQCVLLTRFIHVVVQALTWLVEGSLRFKPSPTPMEVRGRGLRIM